MTVEGSFALAPAPHALLGLWSAVGADPGLSYSAAGRAVAGGAEVVWVVDLPRDRDAARTTLDRAQHRLRQADAAIDDGPERVARWLRDTDRWDEVAARAEDGPVDEHSPVAADVLGVFTRSCTPTALVETRSADQVLGRSRLALSGSVCSLVLDRSRQAVERHEQAVLLTAASRASVLRAAALTVRTAVAIATRLALPGGPLLALPLAWSLLHRATASSDAGREGRGA